jgi:hypothetical protein
MNADSVANADSDAAYRFDPSSLDVPRPAGISAVMRIKNGADYLRLAIESHLPYVDEVVACYNDCSDDTVPILEQLAAEHPGKVRPIAYRPQVHPILSAAHAAAPTESVHSTANYYNFALSQARYRYATKLDDDHLAIDVHLRPAIALVRQALAEGRRELFTFSGLNLVRNPDGRLGVYTPQPFVGTGDHLFFPVCSQIHFVQDPRTEVFRFGRLEGRRIPKRYVGLLYMHLKHCKPGAGFHNLAPEALQQAQQLFGQDFGWMAFEDFAAPRHLRRFRQTVNPLEYWLRTNPVSQGLIHALSGRHAPQKIARLARLESDLAAINFARDVEARVAVL